MSTLMASEQPEHDIHFHDSSIPSKQMSCFCLQFKIKDREITFNVDVKRISSHHPYANPDPNPCSWRNETTFPFNMMNLFQQTSAGEALGTGGSLGACFCIGHLLPMTDLINQEESKQSSVTCSLGGLQGYIQRPLGVWGGVRLG